MKNGLILPEFGATCFLDVETDRLPQNQDLDWKHFENYGKILQLAYVIKNGNTTHAQNMFFLPESDFIFNEVNKIEADFLKINGFTKRYGLKIFHSELKAFNVRTIVCHNVKFDINQILAEWRRNNLESEFNLELILSDITTEKVCTMTNEKIINFLKEKIGFEKDRISLSRLHKLLFGADIPQAHNALADVMGTINIYERLKLLRVL